MLDIFIDVFEKLSTLAASGAQRALMGKQTTPSNKQALPAVECARADEFMLKTAKAMLWGTASLETAKASVNRNARRKSVSNERGGKNSGGRQVSMVQVDDIMNVFLVHWEQEDKMKTVKLKKLFQEHDADGNGTLELEEFKGLMKAVETAFLQSGNGSSASFNEFDIDGDGSMDDSELVTLYLDIMDEALGKPITDEVFARIAKEKLYKILGANVMKHLIHKDPDKMKPQENEDKDESPVTTYSEDEVDRMFEMIVAQQHESAGLEPLDMGSLQMLVAPLLKHPPLEQPPSSS